MSQQQQLNQDFSSLTSYAKDLDFEITEQDGQISLMGHNIAATFPKTLEGIEQANAWLERYEDENFEPSW